MKVFLDPYLYQGWQQGPNRDQDLSQLKYSCLYLLRSGVVWSVTTDINSFWPWQHFEVGPADGRYRRPTLIGTCTQIEQHFYSKISRLQGEQARLPQK